MLTPRIKTCYLPVLQRSEKLQDHQRMLKHSSSILQKPWSKVPKQFKVEKKVDINSVVNDIKNSDKKMYDDNNVNTDELFDAKRKKIMNDIDIINKHVTRKEIEIRKLNDSNADLVKKNNELKQISEEFRKKYQEELREKLSVVQDNQKLASKMQHLLTLRGGGDSTDDKKYEMLVATIKDKDTKLVKLTELIAPLRKKVKEQEGLVGELTLVKSEKKGLMEVNEEIVREITSLNDRHLKAISSKDKQLAMLQEKSSRLMSETKRILEEEKSDFAGQGSKLSLERKRVEELKRSVGAERLAIEEIKTALNDEKIILEDSKQLIDEENDIIEEEKRVIDEEWGDIGRKKKEISEAENEFSEKVKALMQENEKVAVEKSVLEVELSKAHEQLMRVENESNLGKSENTVNEILQQNESAIKSLEKENEKSISELNKKEQQIDVMKNMLDKQGDVLKSSEMKLNEEISIKDGMIQDLEFKVSIQKSQQKEEFSLHKEEIERLKLQIAVLNNNNKRRRSEEECCNISSKKFKPSDETIEVDSQLEVIKDQEDRIDIDDDPNTEEVFIDEVTDEHLDSNKKEQLPSTIDDDEVNVSTSEDSNAVDGVTLGVTDDEISASRTLSKNRETAENVSVEVETSEKGVAPETETALAKDTSAPEAVKDPSALKLIEAMNDFESLIKNSRNQDTLAVQEIVQPEESVTKSAPELNKANQLIKQVDDIIGQTKIINIINTVKKTESIRDVFDDSDEESENEVSISEPSPVVVHEVVNTPQTIKVRDMMTICESKVDSVDSDVIIPTNSGDISIEISEEDETVAKKAFEDANKLKSQVADVVKLSLNKFFQIVDGVETKEDLESLIVRFSNQFPEEIISSHLEKHTSTAGITMTRDHKRSLVDQIIFYFEIKKSVNMNLRKHIHPTSPQFVILSSQLSNQFSKDIMESHRTMFNSLTGLALTPDNHQWIGNNINFKMSSSQK